MRYDWLYLVSIDCISGSYTEDL